MPDKPSRDWIKGLLRKYNEGKNFPVGKWKALKFTCPHEQCGSIYNLYPRLPKDGSIVCPTCLNEINLPNGWRLESRNMRWI